MNETPLPKTEQSENKKIKVKPERISLKQVLRSTFLLLMLSGAIHAATDPPTQISLIRTGARTLTDQAELVLDPSLNLITAGYAFIARVDEANAQEKDLNEIKENKKFRPLDVLINSAMEKYRQQGGHLTFQRDDDYRDWAYYKNVLNTTLNSEDVWSTDREKYTTLLGLKTDEVMLRLERSMPQKAQDFAYFSDAFAGSGGYYRYMLLQHSGVYLHSIVDRGLKPKADNEQEKNIIETSIREYFNRAKVYIEEKVAQNNNQPISSSEVFLYFLKVNNGSVDLALVDTAACLKDATRGGLAREGLFGEDYQNSTIWVQKNILDEFSTWTSFNDMPPPDPDKVLPPEIDPIDRVGEPYHAWNIAASLVFFPPEIIESSTTYRGVRSNQYKTGNKYENDLRSALNVREILREINLLTAK